MRRRRVLPLIGLPAAWAWPRLAGAQDGVGAQELVIGQSLALQGGANGYAVEVQAGIQCVLDAVNATGGVAGRRIVLRTLDDRNDGQLAEGHARTLVDGGAFLLFGSIEGGPCTAVAAVAQQRQVPFFGPIAGSPGLRRPHQPMVFPVRAEHRDEFRALLDWGLRTGLKTVALLHSDSDVGRQHLENTRLLATELGARLAYGVPFKGGIDDVGLQAIVERLRREPVQFMFNHGASGVYARLIRLARGAGVGTVFMGINSGSAQLAKSLGELARGMVFAQVMPSPWSRRTALVRNYQDAFGKAQPGREWSYASLEGYATAQALVAGLRAAGPKPTRASFVQALQARDIDLGGINLHWRPGDHAGSRFVDLAMVSRDGSFIQ